MEVWQLQEHFCNNYLPFWTLHLIQKIYSVGGNEKWKKWFLWTVAASQAAEHHGDEWDMAWYLWWGIHQFQPEPTHKVF